MERQTQIFHFYIPLKNRLRLRVIAEQDGYTMAWLVRALLRAYKKRHGKPPKVENRQLYKCPHVRFNAVFYGDKPILQAWAREHGAELAPVVREIVRLYLDGEFLVDFNDLKNLKTEKKPKIPQNRRKETSRRYLISGYFAGKKYQREEYRIRSPQINYWLMKRGLANKKKSSVEEALLWDEKRRRKKPAP